MNNVKINAVSIVPGAIITKGMTNSGRPGFSIAVHYHLDGGQVITSTVSRERKKDVLGSVERADASAKAGAMEACFDDAGEFWGTSQKFTIGSAGLVPCAV